MSTKLQTTELVPPGPDLSWIKQWLHNARVRERYESLTHQIESLPYWKLFKWYSLMIQRERLVEKQLKCVELPENQRT